MVTKHACGCQVHNAEQKKRKVSPLKADPTRSRTLRRIFETALQKRFRKISRVIYQLVAIDDAFGLKRNLSFNKGQDNGSRINRSHRQLTTENRKETRRNTKEAGRTRRRYEGNNAITNNYVESPKGPGQNDLHITRNERFAFQTTSQQIKSFRKWLGTQIQLDILTSTAAEADRAYWTAFIEEGYKKGQGRAFVDTRPIILKSGTPAQQAFYEGAKSEFLRSSFGSPVAIEKVQLLAGRVFTELRGVTDAMAQGITRELTEGIARGENPHSIARKMQNEIRRIGQRRATLIARTEITRAHAEGQLDAMDKLGVTDVGVAVEWSTAGDDRVCPLCQALGGVVMSIKEARGLLPRHVQCRCAFTPANVGEDKKGQKRSKAQITKAIDKSILRGSPKYKYKTDPNRLTPSGKPVRKRVGKNTDTLKEKRRKSTWTGADAKIDKRRPKSILDD